LQQKHPAAYQYYERYAMGRDLRFVAPRFPPRGFLPRGVLPRGFPAGDDLQGPPQHDREQSRAQIEDARSEYRAALERFRELARSGAPPEELSRAVEQIHAAARKLAETMRASRS
jgi:hypothetical protein